MIFLILKYEIIPLELDSPDLIATLHFIIIIFQYYIFLVLRFCLVKMVILLCYVTRRMPNLLGIYHPQ
jgi:hypothetical protein